MSHHIRRSILIVRPKYPTRNVTTTTPNQPIRSTPPRPTPTANNTTSSSETLSKMPTLTSQTVSPMSTSESGSFHPSVDAYIGLACEPFAEDVNQVLLADVDFRDVEIKPDGLLYLPEIKYRRILNRAFKPGGWAIVPRGPHSFSGKVISREYAMFAYGRFVSQARGEQEVFDEKMLATAMEACKSNAMMRCCKDIGIASELWDPGFIRQFKAKHCEHIWVRHVVRNTKLKLWRKIGVSVEYPYEELR